MTKAQSATLKRAILVLMLELLHLLSCFAQSELRNDLATTIKQHAAWDPGQFLLDKLKTNRIVMVADAGHGDPLYTRTVTNVLRKWLSDVEESSLSSGIWGEGPELCLILERDSIAAEQIRTYFVNGDPLETVDQMSFAGTQFTTGTLEFYSDLRSFKSQVDAINKTRRAKDQIRFDVVGPEKYIDLSNWSYAKRDTFFVRERDEYSSSKIISLLLAKPNAKALIFYGGAHLQKNQVQKLDNDRQSMGFFLCHYLKDRFDTTGGVYVCNQVDVRAVNWIDPGVMQIGKTFAIDNARFENIAVHLKSYFPYGDGVIFHFVPPRSERELSKVYSAALADWVLKGLGRFMPIRSEFQRAALIDSHVYLSEFAGVPWRQLDFSNPASVDSMIESWKAWRDSSHIDIVKDIASLKFFERAIDRIQSAPDALARRYLWNTTWVVDFRVWFNDFTPLGVQAKSLWEYIQKYRKPIIVENLIDILWLGTPTEKEEAVKVLSRETGEDFRTAKEWNDWWESKKTEGM